MAPPTLRSVLEKDQNPDQYREMVIRLLFCTTIVAGDARYRLREIELYHEDDPYTHRGDEQVSSTGGWYFHRTRPGGGWKGGTFMGLDLSFGPVGTAGGILIRGISRVAPNGDTCQYVDGSCNCVKELLKACGVSKIKELVGRRNFKWDALAEGGILRLVEHEPTGTAGNVDLEWKACSRIGLSEPNKFPEKAQARAKYHLMPLRFLQAPYETKKERTKIKNAVSHFFSKEEYEKMNQRQNKMEAIAGDDDDDDDDDEEVKPPPIKKTMKRNSNVGNKLLDSSDEDDDRDTKQTAIEPKKFKVTAHGTFDSDDESEKKQPFSGPKKFKRLARPRAPSSDDNSDGDWAGKLQKSKVATKKQQSKKDKLLARERKKKLEALKKLREETKKKQEDNTMKQQDKAKLQNQEEQHKAMHKKKFGELIDDDQSSEDTDWNPLFDLGDDDENSENEDWDPASKEQKEEDEDDNEEAKNTAKKDNNMLAIKGKPVWHYWLDIGMDGRKKGWHSYDLLACAKLEGFLKNKGKQLSRTTWHLKSGYFSYEVNISNMTQRNMKSGTVRPIRRVLPGEVCSMSEPPIYIPPKKGLFFDSSSDDDSTQSKKPYNKKKADSSPDNNKPSKQVKLDHNHSDGLKLESLFAGKQGHAWEKVLVDVVEAQPNAAQFIGPNRSKEILPIREMTFRALMAVVPEENNLIVFGQAPYPRVESASGIAMFDTLIKNWTDAQFGKTVSMRCIAKTAAVAKGIVSQDANVKTLRRVFKENDIVSPAEWFQAMLAQGVLMLNASLTIGSNISTAKHTNFWKPIMKAIVQEILQAKVAKFPTASPKRRIGFLWWGNEASKTKKFLAPLLTEFSKDVEITHIEHYNPAAQGDKFSQQPNHFKAVNESLVKGNLAPIDWLPSKDWLKAHHLDEHAVFITDTQELHQMYLDRLQAGLDLAELSPILGIMELELLSLPDACDDLGLKTTAASALSTVKKFNEKALDDHEKGAIYLYTTNVLYRRLNEALRNVNRSRVRVYFNYLRVFLQGYDKMKAQPKMLYRGISKDLSKQYGEEAQVVWWSISSCTPNLSVAKAFGGASSTGTLFRVKAKTAVPIMHLSAYQTEEEWVLAPGTTLKVQSVVKKLGQVTEIYLEEVEGKRRVK